MKNKKVIFTIIGIILVIVTVTILIVFVTLNKDEKAKKDTNTSHKPTPTQPVSIPSSTPDTLEQKLQEFVGDNKIQEYQQQSDGTYRVYIEQKNPSTTTGYYIVDLDHKTSYYRSQIKISITEENSSSGNNGNTND